MRFWSMLSVLLLCFCTVPVWGQEVRAAIGGRVTDATGAVIPNAEVTVTAEDTGVEQHTATNGHGNWLVQFLLPGQYRFSITTTGFKKVERRGITLQTADNKTLDIQLEVGGANDSVVVTAEAPLIDTSSASTGAVITSREITEMPSLSRIGTLLAALAPGMIAQDQNRNQVYLWSISGASQIRADGANGDRSNNFLLDGMPNTKKDGQVAFIPSTDILQEFRVQTSAYDSQISRQAGATINMETKAGTKQYHGKLYEYNQNNFLNAKPYGFANTDPVRVNQYGGQFGGPVRIPKVYNGKDKTFFFFAYEGINNTNPKATYRSVPTELERKGDFSQSFTVVGGVRYPINIYDPSIYTLTGTGSSAYATRQQFSFGGVANVIDPARFNPIALKILSYVPLPNSPADTSVSNTKNNYATPSTRFDKFYAINVRVDHQWNDSHRTFGVYRYSKMDENNSNEFLNVATGNHMYRIPRTLGLDHVWTISGTKVLDVRAAVNRFIIRDWDNGFWTKFDQASLGLPQSLVSQWVPSFPNITGFAGDFGDSSASNDINTYYTLTGGLTHMHGNHAFRYGGEYWILQQAGWNPGRQPRFNFGSEWSRRRSDKSSGNGDGSTFASFLLGLPNSANNYSYSDNNASSFYSQRFAGFYFQDDWRLTRNLTLNLGLRWDYERPVVERFNRLTSNFDPTFVSPINASAQASYAAMFATPPAAGTPMATLLQLVPVSNFQVLGRQLFAGVDGQPRTAHEADTHEFQPRLGFAYQIIPGTVIRGGGGRFTQASWTNAGQTGFSQRTNFVATTDNYVTPYDTLSNPFRNGLLQPPGSSLGALSNLGSGPSWYNQNPDRAYTWNYSLTLQQQVKSWLFEVGYARQYTYALRMSINQNLPSYDVWKALRTPTFDANGRPVDKLMWDQTVTNPFYHMAGLVTTSSDYTSTTRPLNQLVRPLTLLSDTDMSNNPIGHQGYDGMLAKVQRRFSRGFSMLTSFTWSKYFDNSSFLGPQAAGLFIEHRLGGEDRPFHLSVAPTWDLPFGRNRAFGKNLPKVLDVLAGGWEASGTFNIQSGTPITFDRSDSAFFRGGSVALPHDKQSLNQWFDTSAFMRFPSQNTCLQNNLYCDPSLKVTYPDWTGIQNMPGYNYFGVAPGLPNSDYKLVNGIMTCNGVCNGVYQDFGTFVRRYPTRFGDIRNPRVNEVNLGIFKNFQATERVQVQFRFEAFNLFNHVRFGGPDDDGRDPTKSGFGKINPIQQNQPRQVQMALKLSF